MIAGSDADLVPGRVVVDDVHHFAAVMGLLLGYATLQTRSLLAGVFLHFANNAIAFLGVQVSPEHLAWMDSWPAMLALCVPGVVALWLLRGASTPLSAGERLSPDGSHSSRAKHPGYAT